MLAGVLEMWQPTLREFDENSNGQSRAGTSLATLTIAVQKQ